MFQGSDDVLLTPQSEDSCSDGTTTGNMDETAHEEQHHRLCKVFEERRAALIASLEALDMSATRANEPRDLVKSNIHVLASETIDTLKKKFPPPSLTSMEVVDAATGINATANREIAESPVKLPGAEEPAFDPAPAFNLELLSSFDGNKDEYGTWEAKTEIVMNAYADPAWQAAVLTALPCKLKGDAASWLVVRWKALQKKSASSLHHPSWETVRDDMRRYFRRPEEEAEELADGIEWDLEKHSATTYLTTKLAGYYSMHECPSEERLIAKLRAGMPEDLQRYVPTSIKKFDEVFDLLIGQEPIWRRTSGDGQED
ncbi:hypothetical protein BCV69DRAFT_282075 [Microstroma glucosiphilum]|uniref:Uncharacterized protein n=1 Tax=Pseudomicrostroma glucosiphilum TaxID=1684307 RepID=A0A316U7W9_9BASI|nr:hypothetical protein BCV69DRAFT_282075 [Pseudomicrostroma glucosiphilum]PWN21340.1 hypothetical protein BCV69DRAFT_282075 [Pseudomicrostroma glucosiphilum]